MERGNTMDINVKQRRKELKFTQQKIAKRLGVSRQYYAYIENNKKVPSVKLAKDIGLILNIDWTIFFVDKVNN